MIFKKKFIHTLPDEPNKTSTRKNLQVECEYSGLQYLLIRVADSTGEILFVERQSDNRAELENDNRSEEGFTFMILDADQNTWEAAYLTGNYTHGVVEDFTETLPTGEVYTFQWADGCGVIGQSHELNRLRYSAGTNTFIRPPYFVLPVTKEGFLDTINNHKADMNKAKNDSSRYTAEQLAEIDSYLSWLNTAADRYKDVDPWKIPTPNYPNLA